MFIVKIMSLFVQTGGSVTTLEKTRLKQTSVVLASKGGDQFNVRQPERYIENISDLKVELTDM